MAGVACARSLHDAGVGVRLLDRGRRLGGRMAVRMEDVGGRRHPVDLGAPYFTARETGFVDLVDGWQQAGLVRAWTDTFTLAGPDGVTGETSGPQRWSTTGGMRSLVEALADGLDVRVDHAVSSVRSAGAGWSVDGEPAAAVVLAMPDPQAQRVLPAELAADLQVRDREWNPVLTVWAAWPQRWWPEFDGMFVADSPVLSWVADSGRSHGDGAAVLVAHSTGSFAEHRLEEPQAGAAPMVETLLGVLGSGHSPEPEWSRVHRWSFASAASPHPEPFLLTESGLGVCGDGWGEKSRVEQAWLSGTSLAQALVSRLPLL